MSLLLLRPLVMQPAPRVMSVTWMSVAVLALAQKLLPAKAATDGPPARGIVGSRTHAADVSIIGGAGHAKLL